METRLLVPNTGSRREWPDRGNRSYKVLRTPDR
jgi:hypothetical protein